MKSTICRRCSKVVDIIDGRWAAHENAAGESCPNSNAIRVEPVIHRQGGGRPEIRFTGKREVDCPVCHEHPAMEYSFKVKGPRPGDN